MVYPELLRYKLKGFKMFLDREEVLGTNHSLSHSLKRELELCHTHRLWTEADVRAPLHTEYYKREKDSVFFCKCLNSCDN